MPIMSTATYLDYFSTNIPASGGIMYPFDARLTLETGVPVSITNQTAKTHLYITKYKGDQVAVFSSAGVSTQLTLSSDIDIDLSGLGRSQAYTNDPAAGSNITLNMTNTAGFLVGNKVKVSSSAGSEEANITVVTANTSITVDTLAINHTTTTPVVTGQLPYDVFVYNNAGVLAAEVLVWTNTTTRATALVLTTNGVLTKSGDPTRRYAGAFSTTTTIGQCEYSTSFMGVDNYYNRVEVPLFAVDTDNSHTYTVATWRAWRGNTVNGTTRVTVMSGVAEDSITVTVDDSISNSAATFIAGGIGINSNSANSAQFFGGLTIANNWENLLAKYRGVLPVGLNFIQRLQWSTATGTTTWAGDNNSVGNQTGMVVIVKG